MNKKQLLKRDLSRMTELFPKMLISESGRSISFSGELDIFDSAGNYWDSFSIRLILPSGYPYGVPVMFETGGKIEPVADRHINSDGTCCVSVEHELMHRATSGLMATDYLLEFAWPYFANQLYYEKKGQYAAGEYAHGLAGVRQFYSEKLSIADNRLALLLLKSLLDRNLPGANQPCLCGSNLKYKHCHRFAAQYLERIPKSRLSDDYILFATFPDAGDYQNLQL